jgi:hypothetical protein
MPRTLLAALLLVVLLPVLVITNASTWALRAVLDDDAFATTVSRTLDTPALEHAMAVAIADAVIDRLALAPAVVEQLGTQILGLPGPVDETSVRAALADRVQAAFADPQVRAARDEVIVSIHQAVLRTGDGQVGSVTIRGSDIILDPTAIVTRIANATDGRIGAIVAASGGRLTAPFVVASVPALQPLQQTLDTLEALQVVLPIAAIAVAVLILLLAHRRLRALRIIGIAMAFAGLITIVLVSLAGRYVATIPNDETGRLAASEVYDAFLSLLIVQSALLATVGLLAALVAWLLGRRHKRAAAREVWPVAA